MKAGIFLSIILAQTFNMEGSYIVLVEGEPLKESVEGEPLKESEEEPLENPFKGSDLEKHSGQIKV